MGKRAIKRILIVLSILCVIILLAYTIFRGITTLKVTSTKRAIEKEIQKIRELGEPTTVEELIPVEIPDNENAALVYNEAFNLQKELEKRYAEEWKYMPYDGPKKWEEITEEQKQKIRDLLFNDSQFLKYYQLLEKASDMKCQFLKRNDYEKGVNILLPHLALMRGCSRMLAAKARLQAEEGEIDSALNTCLTGLKVSKSLIDEPILISRLVRIAMDSIFLGQIEEVLNKGEAKTEIYMNLINEIKREREEKLIYSSLMGERLIFGTLEFPFALGYAQKELREMEQKKGRQISKEEIIEELCEIAGITGLGSEEKNTKESEEYKELKQKMKKTYAHSDNIVGDFFDNQNLYYLRAMAKIISLAKNKHYLDIRELLPGVDREIQNLPKEKAILVQLLMPALERSYLQEARIDAQLASAEIALACRIYKIKYGNYPFSLNQLAPEILSFLSLDPFTGKDFIYKRKGDGFLVYSLGDNCKDDGGNCGKPNKWTGDFDIVFEIKK